MTNVKNIRSEAIEIFGSAVNAADPGKALAKYLPTTFDKPKNNGSIIIIAAGKAAVPMMREALLHVPDEQNLKTIVVTNYENDATIDGVNIMLAGHPIPNEDGARAANAVIELLLSATADDQVIALVSGGASAMLPAPCEGISLADKSSVNEILMSSGFEITELNLVRQQLSILKGGGFNQIAAPAKVTSYILSDVIGDDLRVIASGPTASPIGTRAQALELLSATQVHQLLPMNVLDFLKRDDVPSKNVEAENHLIGSNKMSLSAAFKMATSMGWNARIVDDALTGNVENAAKKISSMINNTASGGQQCLLFGGETSVNVTGTGRGGRNQELALRVAILSEDTKSDWVFLSGGTDGRDGPTDAAGGIVDAKSIQRMNNMNIDPIAHLSNNDAYVVLEASKDLLMTGATGTNVADIQIVLIL